MSGIREDGREAAELLLKNRDNDTSEIAYFVGYGIVDHFIRAFWKKHRVAPGKFRRSASPLVGDMRKQEDRI